MKTVTRVLLAIAVASLAGACTKGSETQTNPPPASSKSAAGPASQPAPSQAAARPARDACALLSAAEATEITGLPIERVEKTTDGCAWYANAAAQREKGTASVAGTFEKMSKQEPASAEEGMRSVESMLKGMIGAAGPSGPLFAVSVQSENADQAEAILKGTGAGLGVEAVAASRVGCTGPLSPRLARPIHEAAVAARVLAPGPAPSARIG